MYLELMTPNAPTLSVWYSCKSQTLYFSAFPQVDNQHIGTGVNKTDVIIFLFPLFFPNLEQPDIYDGPEPLCVWVSPSRVDRHIGCYWILK